MVAVPERFVDALSAEVLSALLDALGPPTAQRAAVAFDVEVELQREGTFMLGYDHGVLRGKKGFAKRPLLSARLDVAAWSLLREELQAAVDGFPRAPALQQRASSLKALAQKDAETAARAVTTMAEGLCVHFKIAGAGSISVARGPVDEATRELTVNLDATQIRGLLAGAPLPSLQWSMKGDRSVGTAIVAALGPMMRMLTP